VEEQLLRRVKAPPRKVRLRLKKVKNEYDEKRIGRSNQEDRKDYPGVGRTPGR